MKNKNCPVLVESAGRLGRLLSACQEEMEANELFTFLSRFFIRKSFPLSFLSSHRSTWLFLVNTVYFYFGVLVQGQHGGAECRLLTGWALIPKLYVQLVSAWCMSSTIWGCSQAVSGPPSSRWLSCTSGSERRNQSEPNPLKIMKRCVKRCIRIMTHCFQCVTLLQKKKKNSIFQLKSCRKERFWSLILNSDLGQHRQFTAVVSRTWFSWIPSGVLQQTTWILLRIGHLCVWAGWSILGMVWFMWRCFSENVW